MMCKAVFWVLIGLLGWLICVIAYAALAMIDGCLGWVEGKVNAAFNKRFGGW